MLPNLPLGPANGAFVWVVLRPTSDWESKLGRNENSLGLLEREVTVEHCLNRS